MCRYVYNVLTVHLIYTRIVSLVHAVLEISTFVSKKPKVLILRVNVDARMYTWVYVHAFKCIYLMSIWLV